MTDDERDALRQYERAERAEARATQLEAALRSFMREDGHAIGCVARKLEAFDIEDDPRCVQARAALTERYGIKFNSGWLNLYRDGRDSVAWHRDKIPRANPYPYVGILTLGSQRRFLARPYGGGPSTRFDPGPGDLMVCGGLMQRQWEHTVPKVREAGARISVTFRHIHDQ